MKRIFLIAVAVPAALLAGKSDPGAPLVAADDAYARASHRDGNWTATRAFALPQSEMFLPERVRILEYGKDAPDPSYRSTGRTEQVWISCDGTAGATLSSWKIESLKLKGWRETVWGRIKDGSWRILLQNADSNPRKLYSKPGRKGARAACTGKPSLPITAPEVGTDYKLGASKDQTLIWTSAVGKAGDLRIVISLWDGTRHEPVLEDVAPAPAPR